MNLTPTETAEIEKAAEEYCKMFGTDIRCEIYKKPVTFGFKEGVLSEVAQKLWTKRARERVLEMLRSDEIWDALGPYHAGDQGPTPDCVADWLTAEFEKEGKE